LVCRHCQVPCSVEEIEEKTTVILNPYEI